MSLVHINGFEGGGDDQFTSVNLGQNIVEGGYSGYVSPGVWSKGHLHVGSSGGVYEAIQAGTLSEFYIAGRIKVTGGNGAWGEW